jgi:hypothetical protein
MMLEATSSRGCGSLDDRQSGWAAFVVSIYDVQGGGGVAALGLVAPPWGAYTLIQVSKHSLSVSEHLPTA